MSYRGLELLVAKVRFVFWAGIMSFCLANLESNFCYWYENSSEKAVVLMKLAKSIFWKARSG